MSGHSKWAQIKRQKGAADAKRSTVFTKLGHAISVAAKDGADPTMNFRLRLIIDQARAVNMPGDTIERAIARGAGADGAKPLEELTYEAYGPAGVALLVNCLTDNRNRAASDVKHVLNDHEATFASTGSVSWLFGHKGVIRISTERLPTVSEELELALIDAGAEDLQHSDHGLTIVTPPAALEAVRHVLVARAIAPDDAALELIPKTSVTLPADAHAKLDRLIADLDALDDVQDIATNSSG